MATSEWIVGTFFRYCIYTKLFELHNLSAPFIIMCVVKIIMKNIIKFRMKSEENE